MTDEELAQAFLAIVGLLGPYPSRWIDDLAKAVEFLLNYMPPESVIPWMKKNVYGVGHWDDHFPREALRRLGYSV